MNDRKNYWTNSHNLQVIHQCYSPATNYRFITNVSSMSRYSDQSRPTVFPSGVTLRSNLNTLWFEKRWVYQQPYPVRASSNRNCSASLSRKICGIIRAAATPPHQHTSYPAPLQSKGPQVKETYAFWHSLVVTLS